MSRRGSKAASRPAPSAMSSPADLGNANLRDLANCNGASPAGNPRFLKFAAVALFVWYFILLLLAWHG